MDIKQYMSSLGKKSSANMTPEQRVARAKKASTTRWSKYKLTYNKESKKETTWLKTKVEDQQ